MGGDILRMGLFGLVASVRTCGFMEAPRRYSVSPLPSFCVVPAPTHRVPSLLESLKSIWRWWRQPKPTLSEQFREAKLIAALAQELEENEPPTEASRMATIARDLATNVATNVASERPPANLSR